MDSDFLNASDDFFTIEIILYYFLIKEDRFSKKKPIHNIITEEDETHEQFHIGGKVILPMFK